MNAIGRCINCNHFLTVEEAKYYDFRCAACERVLWSRMYHEEPGIMEIKMQLADESLAKQLQRSMELNARMKRHLAIIRDRLNNGSMACVEERMAECSVLIDAILKDKDF